MLRALLVVSVLSLVGASDSFAQTPSTSSDNAAGKKTLKVPSEFKRKMVKGEVQYCTKRTIIGTRFPKTICVNEDGLRAMIEQRALDQEELRQKQTVCSNVQACGG
jgi:hypothetical protein